MSDNYIPKGFSMTPSTTKTAASIVQELAEARIEEANRQEELARQKKAHKLEELQTFWAPVDAIVNEMAEAYPGLVIPVNYDTNSYPLFKIARVYASGNDYYRLRRNTTEVHVMRRDSLANDVSIMVAESPAGLIPGLLDLFAEAVVKQTRSESGL
jgi:hypothetical protein